MSVTWLGTADTHYSRSPGHNLHIQSQHSGPDDTSQQSDTPLGVLSPSLCWLSGRSSMASTLPTPPATPAPDDRSVSSEDSDASSDDQREEQASRQPSASAALDELLVRYLDLLNTYMALRQKLSNASSSGYLALAQANFQNRVPGMRFDSSCYDKRMKAFRRVRYMAETDDAGVEGRRAAGSDRKRGAEISIQGDLPVTAVLRTNIETPERLGLRVQTFAKGGRTAQTVEEKQSADTPSASANPIVPPSQSAGSSSVSEAADLLAGATLAPSQDFMAAPKRTASKNPLRWFGIFPPPALSEAQKRFSTVVVDLVPELLGVKHEMEQVEIEIRQARSLSRSRSNSITPLPSSDLRS